MMLISNYINFNWKPRVYPNYFVGASLLQLDLFFPVDGKAQSNLNVGLVLKLQIILEKAKNQTQK